MTDYEVSQYVSGRTIQEQMCNLMEFVSTVNGKSVKSVAGSQTGSTVTVTVTYESGSTDSFSFETATGFITTNGESGTDQVIQNGGLQIANGNVVASGELEGSSVHVSEEEGSMVAEINTDGSSVVSSSGKIYVKAEGTSGNDFVVGDDNCIVNSLDISSSPTASSAVTKATDIQYVSATDGRNNLVHTAGDESISGVKTFNTWLYIAGGHDKTVLRLENSRFDTRTSGQSEEIISLIDTSLTKIASLFVRQEASGIRSLRLSLLNSDGSTYKTIVLGTSD